MSVFDWNTGKQSIFGKLQKDANIAKKSSDNLSAKLGTRPDPVVVAKKLSKIRNANGKTKPLAHRVDFLAVRDYRLSGKSWGETAQHFGCCVRAIHTNACALFPELKSYQVNSEKKRGKKPIPLPLDDIIQSMLAGASLRGASRAWGIAHPTLRHRLMQSAEGIEAVDAARERSEMANQQKSEQAKVRKEAKNA